MSTNNTLTQLFLLKDELEELKAKWRIIREERENKITEMKTPLDDLLKIVEKHKEISLKNLHIKLKVPMNRIKEWLSILEEKEMVELSFSLLGAIKVKINEKPKSDKLL